MEVALFALPAAGATVCPKPGNAVAAAAANAANKRGPRGHALMIASFVVRPVSDNAKNSSAINRFSFRHLSRLRERVREGAIPRHGLGLREPPPQTLPRKRERE